MASQAPLVLGILQARILELSFPPPSYLPNLGIEPVSPALQADSLPTEPPLACLLSRFSRVQLCATP